MSPPRVSEPEPHPAMILWPSFKHMVEPAAGARRSAELTGHEEEEHGSRSSDDDSGGNDFEFAPVVSRTSSDDGGGTEALFPVFDRGSLPSLWVEQHDGLDDGKPGLNPQPERPPAEEYGRNGADYYLWRRKPRSDPSTELSVLESAWKSRSTGRVPARSCPSSPRHELAAAGRSWSDGEGRFSFLASPTRAIPKAAASDRPRKEEDKKKKKKKKATEIDLATAHRLFYTKQDGAGAAATAGPARRSYLPYRKDLIGFFAGGSRFLPF